MEYEIELYAHNADAYEKVKENLKENNRTCIVHATGTGKSFIALQLIYDFIKSNPNKKIVYLTPLSGIKEQVKEHIDKIERDNKEKRIEFHREYFDNIEFINYQALITKSEEELTKLEADLLITDEFHHIGAPEWTRAIDILIKNHPNMKVFGMSATSVRERGTANEKDVTQTFFNGNVASEYPLEEAIADGVLPSPNYHVALVFLEDECRELEEKVKSRKASNEEKEEYKKLLDSIKIKIASMGERTVQDIVKEYIKRDGKYIYFCPQGINIKELQNNFLKMFSEEERKNIEFYTVHSSKYTSKENETMSNNFYNNVTKSGEDARGQLRVMFAINLYNEGIHVPDIDGVIMGRNTESDIVFYQQLGRALAVKKRDDNAKSVVERPLVIDLQDNFRKILKLYKDVEHKQKEKGNSIIDENIPNDRSSKNKRNLFYTFGIDDEIINIVEELDSVKSSLNFKLSLEKKMEEFLIYIKKRKIPVPTNKFAKFSDDTYMGKWFSHYKKKIYLMQAENEIAKEIVKIVESKRSLTFEEKMEEFFEFIKENSIPAAQNKKITFSDGSQIGGWWSDNKKKVYVLQEENEIAKEIVKIVESKRGLTFEEKMEEFLEYLKDHPIPSAKHKKITFSDGSQIGGWWSDNKKKVYVLQEENEIAKEIVKIVELKRSLTFEEKTEEFLDYIRENQIPITTNKKVIFSDGSQMGQWWSKNKEKIYKIQEESLIAKEIVEIVESKRNLTVENKTEEFLDYIRNNPIPVQKNKTAKFSDGSYMGTWWNNNKKKIYALQEENEIVKEIVEIVEINKKRVKETRKEVPNEKQLANAAQKVVEGKPKKKVKKDEKQL